MGTLPSGKQPVSSGPAGSSKTHLDQALAAYSGGSHPALALFAGPDIGVFCRSYLSHLSWHWDDAEAGGRQERGSARGGPAGAHPFSHGDRAGLCRDAARLPAAKAAQRSNACGRGGCCLPQAWFRVLPGDGGDPGGLGDGGGGRCGRRPGAASAGAGGDARPRERKSACRSTMVCWRKRAAALVRLARPWRISPPALRFRARTARNGRWRSCTACRAICWLPTESPSRRGPATGGRSRRRGGRRPYVRTPGSCPSARTAERRFFACIERFQNAAHDKLRVYPAAQGNFEELAPNGRESEDASGSDARMPLRCDRGCQGKQAG